MNNSFFQAEDRVRRMNNLTRGFIEQSRQAAPIEQTPIVSVPRFEPVTATPTEIPREVPSDNSEKSDIKRPAQKNCRTPSNPIDKLFSGKDGERTLIILLIAVLINEKADIKLIAVLLYLIL